MNATSSLVRQQVRDDVLVIEIHNPPINAGSLEVRKGLLAAVEALSRSPELKAGVIIGGGSTFIAGSDLKEFGKPLLDPQLPEVISAIERCAKPVVAAIHGAALGGGFELALGCDARLAVRSAVVGLPEVTLGMIPGAGGTQRLTRRVGIARAIELICTGKRVSAPEALQLGLLDQVVEQDLLTSAVELAQQLQGKKCRIAEEVVPVNTAEQIQVAEQAALRAGRHRPQVVAAIEAIRWAATRPVEEALQSERAAFNSLRLGPDAYALRHQFFAERNAMKLPPELQATPRSFNQLAVIGAGTMGTGIAIAALDAALEVMLLEQNAEALERGRQRIESHYRSRVEAGKMRAEMAHSALGRLRCSLHWPDLAEADLVIEAVFEELQVKQEVFRQLDAHARPGAVLATNTSYLDIDKIARVTARPQDVVGLHFFSPANVMKLLEVVRGAQTSPDVLATGMALGKAMKKLPVLCGNAFGFIGNRIYNAYRKQCEFMLEDGAWPEEIDQALTGMGFAMGPFAVADLSGLDIAWRMRQSQAATRNPQERYVAVLDKLCEQGRLGRKSGAGYYVYSNGKQEPTSDETVRGLIEQASAERGLVRRSLGAGEICRRAMLAMVNEAALLVSEGIAARPDDIDVVMVNGYGFPRWEGGPVYWARQQDRAQLQGELEALAAAGGEGFQVGDLSYLLD